MSFVVITNTVADTQFLNWSVVVLVVVAMSFVVITKTVAATEFLNWPVPALVGKY